MDFWQAVASGFRKYADFTGRARRSEFWWWVLFTTVVNAALGTLPLLGLVPAQGAQGAGLSAFWTVVTLVPSVAVAVRRLRDAGIGWGHVLWAFVPVVGLVVLAILAAQPSRVDVRPASPAPVPAAAAH